MKHYNIPIFISHFGCPNDCVFCNQKKINGRETDITIDDIKNIIERYLKTLPKKSKKEVAFFGGTFTGISLELQTQYLETVYEYKKKKLIDGIRLSTRPDYIDEKIIENLKKYEVTTVELGVQSFDEDVLLKTHRFYPMKKVYEASKLIKEAGIELGIQLMPGLPGSTKESDIYSALETVKIGPNIARVYPTLVIKETTMERMYKENLYSPLTIEEAIERCKEIQKILELNKIKIIRVGLQPTEELNDSKNVIAGPFHPAFKELVVGEIYYEFLNKILKRDGCLEIEANEKDISSIIGINKKNKKRLNLEKIRLNADILRGNIRVNAKIYTWEQILKGDIDESNCNKHK